MPGSTTTHSLPRRGRHDVAVGAERCGGEGGQQHGREPTRRRCVPARRLRRSAPSPAAPANPRTRAGLRTWEGSQCRRASGSASTHVVGTPTGRCGRPPRRGGAAGCGTAPWWWPGSLVPVLVIGLVWWLAGRGDDDRVATEPTDRPRPRADRPTTRAPRSPPAPVADPPQFEAAPDPPVAEARGRRPWSPRCGDITLELDGTLAPQSVANFVQLARGRVLRRDAVPPADHRGHLRAAVRRPDRHRPGRPRLLLGPDRERPGRRPLPRRDAGHGPGRRRRREPGQPVLPRLRGLDHPVRRGRGLLGVRRDHRRPRHRPADRGRRPRRRRHRPRPGHQHRGSHATVQ